MLANISADPTFSFIASAYLLTLISSSRFGSVVSAESLLSDRGQASLPLGLKLLAGVLGFGTGNFGAVSDTCPAVLADATIASWTSNLYLPHANSDTTKYVLLGECKLSETDMKLVFAEGEGESLSSSSGSLSSNASGFQRGHECGLVCTIVFSNLGVFVLFAVKLELNLHKYVFLP